jgi:signal-transduction protein with cAMP-binding, CBS, and nucleotidyltransferase domain
MRRTTGALISARRNRFSATCSISIDVLAMANRILYRATRIPRRTAMATVKQVLSTKADRAVYTIDPEASVYDAIALMSKAGIGALVVTVSGRADGALCGIVTERDYARKVILLDKSSRTTTVCEIMTAHVLTTALGDDADDCMALMTQRRLRHLPVMEGGRLAGMISIGDMVRHLMQEQQFAIDQLENYVRGPRAELPTCALTRRSPLPETLVSSLV